jgi:2-amino-4-hydroxy-6-hydroxymethyldihydropteridine diphosphokinase
MTDCYLGLGTNLGDKEENIHRAITKIEALIGTVVRQSALYVTEPWGFQSAHTFLNAAVCCQTDKKPREVLQLTQQIERELGRSHKSVNGEYHDRLIDIDILLYGDEHIDEPDLKIPHPLMHERDFVMKPLNEIVRK